MDILHQWNRFVRNHVFEWRGTWTRYTPKGEVIENFPSIRRFVLSDDGETVAQANHEQRSTGTTTKEWTLNRSPQFGHPSYSYLRDLYSDTGAAIWTSQQQTEKPFACEVFFRRDKQRVSVGIVYEGSHNLGRFGLIRESAIEGDTFWSHDLICSPSREIRTGMRGTAVITRYGIELEEYDLSCNAEWPLEGRAILHMPENISVNVPEHLPEDGVFDLLVRWEPNETEVVQHIVRYSGTGEWPILIQERYHLL